LVSKDDKTSLEKQEKAINIYRILLYVLASSKYLRLKRMCYCESSLSSTTVFRRLFHQSTSTRFVALYCIQHAQAQLTHILFSMFQNTTCFITLGSYIRHALTLLIDIFLSFMSYLM